MRLVSFTPLAHNFLHLMAVTLGKFTHLLVSGLLYVFVEFLHSQTNLILYCFYCNNNSCMYLYHTYSSCSAGDMAPNAEPFISCTEIACPDSKLTLLEHTVIVIVCN